MHLNQTPPQDEGTKVICEEMFAQPVRKRWYIDLTNEDAEDSDGKKQEKKRKTGPKHESEVIDLT